MRERYAGLSLVYLIVFGYGNAIEFDYGYASLVNRLAGVDNDVQGDDIPFTDYPETETKWLMTNITEAATGQPVGMPRMSRMFYPVIIRPTFLSVVIV